MAIRQVRLLAAAVSLVLMGGVLVAQSTRTRVRVQTGPITVNTSVSVPSLAHMLGDDNRPGPDSAQVEALLAGLGRADPVVCEMAVDNLGNFWGGWARREVGALHDRAPAAAAREAFDGRVKNAGAVGVLARELGHANPCVRRAAARMLGESSNPEALARLRTAFRSGDPRVRAGA